MAGVGWTVVNSCEAIQSSNFHQPRLFPNIDTQPQGQMSFNGFWSLNVFIGSKTSANTNLWSYVFTASSAYICGLSFLFVNTLSGSFFMLIINLSSSSWTIERNIVVVFTIANQVDNLYCLGFCSTAHYCYTLHQLITWSQLTKCHTVSSHWQ